MISEKAQNCVSYFSIYDSKDRKPRSHLIAIGDLQVKVAELQRSRAELADKVREKVADALTNFDDARTQFQTTQIVAARTIEQFKIYELQYVRGSYDTEAYLSRR